MGRVKRIYVLVEIEDDDGAVSTHEVDGTPRPGTTVAQIMPHFRSQIHRRAGYVVPEGVVEVAVRLDAVLDYPAFRVTEDRPTLRIVES